MLEGPNHPRHGSPRPPSGRCLPRRTIRRVRIRGGRPAGESAATAPSKRVRRCCPSRRATGHTQQPDGARPACWTACQHTRTMRGGAGRGRRGMRGEPPPPGATGREGAGRRRRAAKRSWPPEQAPTLRPPNDPDTLMCSAELHGGGAAGFRRRRTFDPSLAVPPPAESYRRAGARSESTRIPAAGAWRHIRALHSFPSDRPLITTRRIFRLL
jgi:hypothetical protein